jgi:hypothetical protein
MYSDEGYVGLEPIMPAYCIRLPVKPVREQYADSHLQPLDIFACVTRGSEKVDVWFVSTIFILCNSRYSIYHPRLSNLDLCRSEPP